MAPSLFKCHGCQLVSREPPRDVEKDHPLIKAMVSCTVCNGHLRLRKACVRGISPAEPTEWSEQSEHQRSTRRSSPDKTPWSQTNDAHQTQFYLANYSSSGRKLEVSGGGGSKYWANERCSILIFKDAPPDGDFQPIPPEYFDGEFLPMRIDLSLGMLVLDLVKGSDGSFRGRRTAEDRPFEYTTRDRNKRKRAEEEEGGHNVNEQSPANGGSQLRESEQPMPTNDELNVEDLVDTIFYDMPTSDDAVELVDKAAATLQHVDTAGWCQRKDDETEVEHRERIRLLQFKLAALIHSSSQHMMQCQTAPRTTFRSLSPDDENASHELSSPSAISVKLQRVRGLEANAKQCLQEGQLHEAERVLNEAITILRSEG